MNMRLVFGIVAATAGLIVTGCGGGNTSTGRLPDPTVKFINVCPAPTNVDFDLNTTVSAANIAFAATSGNFKDIEFRTEAEGAYDVVLRSAGGVSQLDNVFQLFNRDTHSIILSYGLPNPAGELTKRAQLVPFTIDRSAPTGSRSRLIVMNCYIRSTGLETPGIDFQSYIPGDASSIDNPQFKLTGLELGAINVGAQTLNVDSGIRSFLARRTEVVGLEEFARVENITLQAGRIYLMVLTGQEGASSASLLPAIKIFEIETKN